LPWIKNI